MAAKGQSSAREAWPPILGSQLHLGVTIRLPRGSMGSHYHRHMLMTPINSPSVGPMQPSVLKVKGRGTGSGWFFPEDDSHRPVCVACVCKHVPYNPCIALCIKSIFIIYWYMPCVYTGMHSVYVCVHVCTMLVY